MFNLGTTELLIILGILLLLFGAKKLPELSKGIGQSLKEVRKGLTDDTTTTTQSTENATNAKKPIEG